MTKRSKKLLLLILIVFIITPLGVLTNFAAWGEWEHSYFMKMLGYIPGGIKNSSRMFKPLLPDYQVMSGSRMLNQYLSALIGILLIVGIFFIIRLALKIMKFRSK